ncbi:hypothetical protein O3G_MSEX006958, partial [Manduca sexta]
FSASLEVTPELATPSEPVHRCILHGAWGAGRGALARGRGRSRGGRAARSARLGAAPAFARHAFAASDVYHRARQP